MYSTSIDHNLEILSRWRHKFNEALFNNILPLDTNLVIGVLTGTKQKSRFEHGVLTGVDARVSDIYTFDGDIFRPDNSVEIAVELIDRMLDQYDAYGYTTPENEKAPKKISSRGRTSGSAYYNRTYKYEAEKHGLLVKDLGSKGSTHYKAYGITDEVKKIIEEDGGFFTAVRESSTYKDKATSKEHDWRGWCPKCGAKDWIISATKCPPPEVDCHLCGEPVIWEPRPHGRKKKKAA